MMDAGLKQIELARLAGVARATVSLWIKGTTKTIEADKLFRVAAVLNVDPHWLQTGEEKQAHSTYRIEDSAARYNNNELNFLHKFRLLTEEDQLRTLAIIDALQKHARHGRHKK